MCVYIKSHGGEGMLQRLMVNQPNQSHTLTQHTHSNPCSFTFSQPCVHQIHPATQAPPPPLLLHCSGLNLPALWPSVPAVVLDHVGQLDDELAFLVLLTALKGMFLPEHKTATKLWFCFGCCLT